MQLNKNRKHLSGDKQKRHKTKEGTSNDVPSSFSVRTDYLTNAWNSELLKYFANSISVAAVLA